MDFAAGDEVRLVGDILNKDGVGYHQGQNATVVSYDDEAEVAEIEIYNNYTYTWDTIKVQSDALALSTTET